MKMRARIPLSFSFWHERQFCVESRNEETGVRWWCAVMRVRFGIQPSPSLSRTMKWNKGSMLPVSMNARR